MAWCKEAFHGYESRMLQSSILIDVLSFAHWEKKKKEKKGNDQGTSFPGPDIPCWLCCMGFCECSFDSSRRFLESRTIGFQIPYPKCHL
jgi:hypothetical protein